MKIGGVMSKSIPPDVNSSPIFLQLKEKKLISPNEYDDLWKVMKKLGYSDFMSREQGIITLKFLKGENVFGVLPTAGGKSFTFQTVARMTDGLTIVISPLIALMKNLVGKHRDGASLYFNSDLSPFERKEVKRRIREGKVKLLYISPERLKSTDFKDLLNSSKQRVKRLVIDEAHCVVEWGYSFRVKYLHIAQEIDAFENQLDNTVPILLLTATASPWLQREIVKNLQIDITPQNLITQKEGIDRPELVIRLRSAKSDREKIRWIAEQLKRGGGFYGKRGIIFSAFADGGEGLGARNAPGISEELKELGVKRIGYYHGGMELEERRNIQNEFQTGKLNVLIATKAFGMGIDLPKLDFIVHFYPPISLEEYWQEAGRGGRGMDPRNGEYCQCVVLHKPSDYKLLQGFPNLASFEKILSTFTSAAQDTVCFNVDYLADGGHLRKLLTRLREQKYIRKLKDLQIGRTTLERWKFVKPARTVLKHIQVLFRDEGFLESKQTNRLQSNLKIRADRSGKIINVSKALNYYSSELNWFTEPEIHALAMIDDEIAGNAVYTRFKLLKDNFSPQEMKVLAQKINGYRNSGYTKLDFVFNSFLNAKRGKEKSLILGYLALKKKPA
jgi:RecQ family ATP-dependent DNA helicase